MPPFNIYAPLFEFEFRGKKEADFNLGRGVWIKHFHEKLDLKGQDSYLNTIERDQVYRATYWLAFDWDEGTQPAPAETVNLVLLALWLVKPTKVRVDFRFHLGSDPQPTNTWVRLLDRFQWIPNAIQPSFGDSDLLAAASYYQVLHDLCCAKGRLNNALLLTVAGCWSNHWQVALICYASAAETILTYDESKGITKRLAKSYACLLGKDKPNRDKIYLEFADLYSARSDIMHGRTHNVQDTDRLPTLARFGEALRRLWRTVLSSQSLIQVLEGTDAQRKEHFRAFQVDYIEPDLPLKKRT